MLLAPCGKDGLCYAVGRKKEPLLNRKYQLAEIFLQSIMKEIIIMFVINIIDIIKIMNIAFPL